MDIASAATTAFLTMVGVVVALFILAWPAYRIVSMWIMKELTAAEAVAALVVLLGFLAGIITTWGQPANLLLWVLLVALAGIIWFGGKRHEKRRLDAFFRADIAASERALAKDPDNAAAHMRLGDLYERRGDLETAVARFQEVCRLLPRDSEARLRLANAVERHRRSALGTLTCWKCATENANTAAHCRECGALISDRNQIIEWLGDTAFSRSLPYLAGAFLVTAVVGSLVPTVPTGVAALSYLLLFAVVLCYVYPRWARRRS